MKRDLESNFTKSNIEILREGPFKFLLIGVTSHAFTLWMEIVARNWLIWEMTGSIAAVGLVNFWRTIPVLFLAIPAGVIADRFDRRAILIITQIGILLVYGSIVFLLIMDLLSLMVVYGLFFLRGVMIAFNQPPRQALIPTLVGKESVSQAVALQQLLFNGTRIISPILAGFLFATAGSIAVFAVITGIEMVVILAWISIKVPPSKIVTKIKISVLESTIEGLKYVKGQRVVLLLLLYGFISLLLLQPFIVILPSLAGERFNIGPEGFGAFVSMMGIGSLIGPLILTLMGDFKAKGTMVSVSMCFSGFGLIALGLSPFLVLTMGILIIIGLFDSAQRTVTNGLLLTLTDPEYHGRVISLYLLDRGFVPLGSLFAGYAAESIGAPFALIIMGGTLSVGVLILVMLKPNFLKAR